VQLRVGARILDWPRIIPQFCSPSICDVDEAQHRCLACQVLLHEVMIVLRSILVDIDPEFPDHPALEHAVALAARHGARVKVVDVLPCVPESARSFVTAGLEAGLVEHRRERLAAIAEHVTDVPVTTELLRGRPGSALIQEVVRAQHDLVVRSHGRDLGESRNIDVVVMGTVARTGIAGLVMGNTAERVLRRLRGSVLAVKPPGFQSPVIRHER